MHSCKAEDYYTDIIVAPQQRKVSLTIEKMAENRDSELIRTFLHVDCVEP